MAETVNLDVTTLEETVSVTTTDGGTVEVAVQAQRGETGATGATGAAGPNSVTSATTTDFTTGQVLYANGSNVGSLSRSGVDTRTTFPNDDVTAATASPDPDTIVKRNGAGDIVASSSFLTNEGGGFSAGGVTGFTNHQVTLNYPLTTASRGWTLPDANGDLRIAPIVVSANYAARAGQDHIVVATATLTDPSPSEGAWYRVIVRNGTATVGGTAYATSGTIIERSYHSGAWANRVYNETPVLGTNVSTALSTAVGSAGAFVVNGGALGTPSSGTLTSCTGLPISTGVSGLGANVATFLATPSSANLAAAVTDETGTGSLCFATSPTLTTVTLSGAQTFTGGTSIPMTATTTNSDVARFVANTQFAGFRVCSVNTTNGTPYLSLCTGAAANGSSFGTQKAFIAFWGDTANYASVGYGGSSHAMAWSGSTGQCSFNGTTFATSAQVQIDSTTRGFLPPRMTTAQRDAISSPTAGLMIYNTTTNKLNIYTTAWEAITSA